MIPENKSFSQSLEAARQLLPKIGDSPELKLWAKDVSGSLIYFSELLAEDSTTALDLGNDIQQLLTEIAMEVGEIASKLVTDDPKHQDVLHQFDYYDEDRSYTRLFVGTKGKGF